MPTPSKSQPKYSVPHAEAFVKAFCDSHDPQMPLGVRIKLAALIAARDAQILESVNDGVGGTR